jgi:hypothetical protein
MFLMFRSSGHDHRPMLPLSLQALQPPTFWDRYINNGFRSPTSFDRLHHCISINRAATLNDEDVRSVVCFFLVSVGGARGVTVTVFVFM